MMSLLPYSCLNGLVPPNLYEDPFGPVTHRAIPARGRCVVVAIARNCGSTSNVFCRKIDNSGSGEGDPFQLRKSENRSFWTNEEVTNERLKFGCLLEYRVVTCHQSLIGRLSELGEQDGKQFIFHRNAGTEPQNVDKILLDLQDDESVHGGLQEALEYYNQKDADRILLDSIHLILDDCERLVEAHKLFNRKDVYELLKYVSPLNAHWEHYEDLGKLLKYVSFWIALLELNEDLDEEAWDLQDDESVDGGLEEAQGYVNQEDLDEEAWDLQDDESVDGGLVEAQGYVNQEFQGLQAHLACTRIFFVGIRAGMINNERVTLETMNGEWLEMPLNCRESLVLSTGPVHLQLNRPWDVADDDVGGVAVVKYEAGKATCEGLILRYKPYVISRDEEPVEIKTASGKVIPVHRVFQLESGQKRWKVLFDTGNEAGTGISKELLSELNLQADPKKKEVELIGGGSCEYETVQIDLFIRGFHFPANGLVGAVAKDTNLLVGMDVIKKLYDQEYTIGS